jgi:hypothetical protein
MTTTATPFGAQTDDERRAALLVANDVRARRSLLRAGIRAGEINAADVVADPPGYAFTMKVSALLSAVPKFGPVRVRRTLTALAISDRRTLGGLSDRQRRDLTVVLGGDPSSDRGGRGV